MLTVDAFLRQGPRVTVTTDASPYGLGAVLDVDGVISSYFSSQITDMDRQILSLHENPSSRDQQVLEGLALLVALRQWAPYWKNRRVVLSVRTDNIATLTMACKMQPHSDQMAIIARELALDIYAAPASLPMMPHILSLIHI